MSKEGDATRIFVPKHGGKLGAGFSKKDVIDSYIHPGRRTDGSQTPAHWITELADTRKAILLCSFCRQKFDFKKHKYRKNYTPDPTGVTSGYVCNGQCDACKQPTEHMGGGVLFIAEDYWEQICVDPQVARINARMAWRKHPARRTLKPFKRI